MTAGRRPRALTGEELALWAEIVKGIAPLRGRPRPRPPEGSPAAAPAPAPPPPRHAPAPAKPAALKPPPLTPLDRRARRQLRRGRGAPDAAIDLHGLTQEEAHGALLAFLRRSQGEGARLVLVVTGKGAGGAEGTGAERGVLARVVPHWLRLPALRPLVLGFEEAGPRQGGAGALYVRLRRPGRAG